MVRAHHVIPRLGHVGGQEPMRNQRCHVMCPSDGYAVHIERVTRKGLYTVAYLLGTVRV